MDDPLVYEVAEVAQLLDISENSTYAAIHRGEIPSIRLGRRLLVPRRALHALLAASDGAGEGEAA